MTKRDRFRYEMFLRVVQFITDNAADFPSGIAHDQKIDLEAIIGNLQTLMGDQSAGLSDARFQFNSKATARENLREALSDIAETARSMIYIFPGIDLKFRMPRGGNDADLLASARAFQTEATALAGDFTAYGMDANFLTQLAALIADFEQAAQSPGSATDQHVEATADIGEGVRLGMIAVRTMDAPVRNKYSGNAGKTAAWESASHVERAPKPPAPPPV